MNEWQPIETAPKDGTEILVWEPFRGTPGGQIAVVEWTEHRRGIWRWIVVPNGSDDYEWVYLDATHWMPLPEPPE